jgi:dUTP pyrophosphatase
MENNINIQIKKLTESAITPNYAHPGDAGLDIYSDEDCTIKPNERKLVSTGISIAAPPGYVLLIKDKSGVAYKGGLTHMAGVIEHTYRGEYRILLYNTTNEDYIIKKGQKIAQIVIVPVATAKVEVVDELSETQRGDGAFGSTGL